MSISLAAILLVINYLQICWFIGYNKYFNLRQMTLLTVYLFFQLIVSQLYGGILSLLLFIPFMIIEFSFIAYFSKSWALGVLYSFIQNTLLIFSWLLTWDILNILAINHFVTLEQLEHYKLVVLLLQQLLLLFFIFIIKKIISKYIIFKAVSQLPKKYVVQSICCFILLLSLTVVRQVTIFDLKYSYLIFVLLAFSGIFGYIAYITGRVYLQKIFLLSKQLNRESEKIILANEFRHDYRNILGSLSTYLEQGQVDQARSYLLSITDYSTSFIEEDYYSQISAINITPVQGILINFFENCLKNDISIRFSLNEAISYFDLTIHLLDFVRCLSILLDNAFEASLGTKNPLIQITIKNSESSLYVEIKNTYEGTISVEKILKNHFTTKDGHQGKGLPIFIKLLKQYRKTSYSFHRDDHFFIASFSISKTDN